jgi:hypothetical protein
MPCDALSQPLQGKLANCDCSASQPIGLRFALVRQAGASNKAVVRPAHYLVAVSLTLLPWQLLHEVSLSLASSEHIAKLTTTVRSTTMQCASVRRCAVAEPAHSALPTHARRSLQASPSGRRPCQHTSTFLKLRLHRLAARAKHAAPLPAACSASTLGDFQTGRQCHHCVWCVCAGFQGQPSCRTRVHAEPDNKSVQYNTEFGYSRKDVIIIGVGLVAFGYALYYGLQALGVEQLTAGNVTQLIIFVGLCVGWIGSYVYRVANKVRCWA